MESGDLDGNMVEVGKIIPQHTCQEECLVGPPMSKRIRVCQIFPKLSTEKKKKIGIEAMITYGRNDLLCEKKAMFGSYISKRSEIRRLSMCKKLL